MIDHGNGFTTLYAHCTDLNVAVGDKVKKGDTIATTGSTGMSTGVHCHYEIQAERGISEPREIISTKNKKQNFKGCLKNQTAFHI